ncbi:MULTISPECIES: hypothetical protein [Rhodococcus]|uniref:hypothetical protein n=1 Tax=Rhodococcus TaxID=1827 RepID=UPI0013A5AEF1|nr:MULTISPECIES: hypothetical protein [Rhodococcus]QTJ71238.1 hypothetical protein HYG77_38585 [Rhodococcus sp. ZPP]
MTFRAVPEVLSANGFRFLVWDPDRASCVPAAVRRPRPRLDLQSARESVIGAFRPLDPAEVVLGQYEGYRDVDGVADDSWASGLDLCE